MSRRGFLAGGLGAAAAAAAFGVGLDACSDSSAKPAAAAATGSEIVPFYGPHQAGIATPAQLRLAFATFDVAGPSHADLAGMLRVWTGGGRGDDAGEAGAGRLRPTRTRRRPTPGRRTGSCPGTSRSRSATGRRCSIDASASRTGSGRSCSQALPPLPNEVLDPGYVGGDIAIQACSDDPLVAFHALRNLARIGIGTVAMRWMQIGFGSTARTSRAGRRRATCSGSRTARATSTAPNAALMDQYVWIGERDRPTVARGTVATSSTRRIRMFIENWDRDRLGDQEDGDRPQQGRRAHRSPGKAEFDTPDFNARDARGDLVIPDNAHIRLASHETNDGLRIRRRGYSYTDGIDPVRGTLLGGLFFVAYMQSPEQFVTLQRNARPSTTRSTSTSSTTAAAIFVCPPGLRAGQDWAGQLFSNLNA